MSHWDGQKDQGELCWELVVGVVWEIGGGVFVGIEGDMDWTCVGQTGRG